MDKKVFAFLISVLIFLAFVAAGAYTIGLANEVSEILQSPAMTSNVTIDKLIITSDKASVKIEGFTAEFNSKILDLILASID